MERLLGNDPENARGDEGRRPKKTWCTPVLIIADVSASTAGKTVELTEVSTLLGPGS